MKAKSLNTIWLNGKWFRVLPFYLFTFLPLNLAAQTFLDRLQQPVDGQGRVTVHQDSTLNALVLDPQSTLKPEDRRPSGTGHTPAAPARTPQSTAPNDSITGTSPGTTTTTTPQSPRNRRSVNGFRIQAYAGGNSREDRKRAERAASDIKGRFPNVAVSAHFYPPRWICYVGNYRTREEAEQMLRSIKSIGYSQALIVRAKVTVR